MAHLAHRTQGKRNPQANAVSQDTSSNSRCPETIQEIGSSSEGSHVPQQDESLYRSLPYIVLSGAKWIPPFWYTHWGEGRKMKTTAPNNLDEYFRDTEYAARHLYAGLHSCWSYYQQALEHWDLSQVGQPMTPEKEATLKRYLELAEKYFDLKFSEASFGGAILQVAYMAIRLYSRNNSIPSNFASLVRPSKR
jgi:hypothetical protein